MKPSFRLGVVVVLLVLFLLILVRVLRTVPAGHVGLVDFFGYVRDTTLNPGLHLVNPLAKVHRLSVQTRENKQTMDTPSSEGLIVHLEVSLISHLNPAKAVEVYKTIGLDYDSILVVPNVRSAVREVTSSFEAKALYSTEREKMSRLITEHIVAAIEPRGIIVERVLMRDVALPPRLQASIEEKLSAEQDAERMHFVLVKERQEAERRRIEAEGIAKFQQIVTEGITENLLKWKGLEATKELATSSNAKIVIIGAGKDGLPVILGSDSFSSPGGQ